MARGAQNHSHQDSDFKKPELTNRRASFLATTQACTHITWQRRTTLKCQKHLGISVTTESKPLRSFAAVSKSRHPQRPSKGQWSAKGPFSRCHVSLGVCRVGQQRSFSSLTTFCISCKAILRMRMLGYPASGFTVLRPTVLAFNPALQQRG